MTFLDLFYRYRQTAIYVAYMAFMAYMAWRLEAAGAFL